MKFLGFLLLVVIVVLGVGYYLDWFKFSSASQGEKVNMSMEVNKQQIKEDVGKVQEKAKNILPKSESKDKQPATTP